MKQKLTSRVRGMQQPILGHVQLPGKIMVEEKTTEGSIITFKDEEPISPALKVEDYELKTQLENGTFLNKEMPAYIKNDKLDVEEIERQITQINDSITYEKAKQEALSKQEETKKQQTTEINYTTTTENN